ncbi:MAG: NAD-dependent epimerase/dehydratase family protein [Ignavibacteria bacterium]|nr:NAD-dependent epimerase/dehydratase family protein [Ignavibacteria bacterium]
MKTILITGINGFLGSNLAKRFSKKFNVVGTEFSLENLFRIKDLNIPTYLSNQENIKKLFEQNKVDIIIHTATFYGRNNEDISQIIETNLMTPLNVLDMAIKYNVGLFINTDTALDRYTNAYALTKKQFKDWLLLKCDQIKSVNLQLEHFYGPGASNTNLINTMIERLQKNEISIDLTLGEQKRDFVFYEDILDAYELIVNLNHKLPNKFNHFEVGSGDLISIKELMTKLKRMTNSSSTLNFGAISYRENELMKSVSDNTPLLKLGWIPKTKIDEGLLKTIIGKRR